jgi:hypothetical protein
MLFLSRLSLNQICEKTERGTKFCIGVSSSPRIIVFTRKKKTSETVDK